MLTTTEILTTCKGCVNSDFCKYVEDKTKLDEKTMELIQEVVKPDGPFSINVNCKYYKGFVITQQPWTGDGIRTVPLIKTSLTNFEDKITYAPDSVKITQY